ncbi:MAG: ferritin family protein [Thermodesulfobacteriota bacterium]
MGEKLIEKLADDLSLAHNTELRGYYFYKAAAELMSDERGRDVFSHLASEEIDHIRVIKAIATSLKDGLGWMSYADAIKHGSEDTKEGLPIYQGKNELIEQFKSNQSDITAIDIAIDNEEKAVEFYSRLLKEATEPEEKDLLGELLQMEQGHLKLLQWESDAVKETGFCCDRMEFTVEGEV